MLIDNHEWKLCACMCQIALCIRIENIKQCVFITWTQWCAKLIYNVDSYIDMYVRVLMCMYICVYMCVYMCVWVCACMCAYKYMCLWLCLENKVTVLKHNDSLGCSDIPSPIDLHNYWWNNKYMQMHDYWGFDSIHTMWFSSRCAKNILF